ncbi:MAG TPA: GWxTD domain-containing protein [Gemmatimonadaceae bacterium]
MPTQPCRRRTPAWALAALLPLALLVGAGCSRAPRAENGTRPEQVAGESGLGVADVARVYERAGFIAEGGQVPFIGTVGYFASARPDSTLSLVALSLANRALSFTRGGDQYQGAYTVTLEVRRDSVVVHRVEAREQVRVASFRETTRGDESIIFQQYLPLAPGNYALLVAVRDEQSGRTGRHEAVLLVPSLVAGSLSTPLAVYEAHPRMRLDSLPALIANPRTTLVFGRDSAFQVYLEAYRPPAPVAAAGVAPAAGDTARPAAPGVADGAPVRVALTVHGGTGAPWADTVSLPARGRLASGVADIPVSPLGIGLLSLVARRLDAAPGDSARAALLVSFGENLAVASFEQMLDYLRYFGTPDRVRQMRELPREAQASAWAVFLRETDPNPSTPENEAVRDYFQRLELANERFRGEGAPGWLTDRGRVLIGLGEPDQVYEQGIADLSTRGRTMIWQYNRYRTQLVFVDQTGFGRWRLTTGSEHDFESLLRRVRSQR